MSKLENLNTSRVRSRVKYDAEFKHQVLEVWRSVGYTTIVECAKSYGIRENTLYGWIYHSKHNSGSTETQHTEVVSLKKELSRAKMELDILKKAAIYFASHAK